MIIRLPDSSIQFTDKDGHQVTLTVFNSPLYGDVQTRMAAQAGGVSKNQTSVNNYNGAVANMQMSVDAGLAYNPATLPPVPQMEVWPDDPSLPMTTQPFPAGVLAVLHAATDKTPTPSQGGLGPDNPNRTTTPLDPALAARFDRLEQMLQLIWGKVNK